MDIVLQQVGQIVVNTFKKNIQFAVALFMNFNHFMSQIRVGKISFMDAVPFSFLVAFCMSFFESLVYTAHTGEPSAFIFVYLVIFTWFMIVMCGMALWLASFPFGGSASLLTTITAFNFLSLGFVLMRIFEIPSSLIRHKVILSQSEPFQRDISGLISQGVSQNAFSMASSFLVLLGYVVLSYWIYRMVRVIHQLKWWQAVFASGLGVCYVGVLAIYIQYPIVQLLLFANRGS